MELPNFVTQHGSELFWYSSMGLFMLAAYIWNKREKSIEEMTAAIKAMDEKITKLDKDINEKLAKLDEKVLEKVDKKLEGTDEACESRVKEIYAHIETIRGARNVEMADLNKRLSTLEGEHKAQHSGGKK